MSARADPASKFDAADAPSPRRAPTLIPTSVANRLPVPGIAFLNDNDFSGTMPVEVCARRNGTVAPGVLGTLVADCGPGGGPGVACDCYSSCGAAP